MVSRSVSVNLCHTDTATAPYRDMLVAAVALPTVQTPDTRTVKLWDVFTNQHRQQDFQYFICPPISPQLHMTLLVADGWYFLDFW